MFPPPGSGTSRSNRKEEKKRVCSLPDRPAERPEGKSGPSVQGDLDITDRTSKDGEIRRSHPEGDAMLPEEFIETEIDIIPVRVKGVP
jgi:hypothetical protein